MVWQELRLATVREHAAAASTNDGTAMAPSIGVTKRQGPAGGGRGPRGRSGKRGRRGAPGRHGEAGQDAPADMIETLAKRLEQAERDLRVQFTRIAQLEADLDTLGANRRTNG